MTVSSQGDLGLPTIDNSNAVFAVAPGSGGVVDREDSIPVADAEPGVDALAASSHKRKQSGIPLASSLVIDRASVQTQRLESTDEGDEEVGGMPNTSSHDLRRTNSSSDLSHLRRASLTRESSGSGSNMPEISELFPEEGWSYKLKSVFMSKRGLALTALLMVVVAYATLKPSSAKDVSEIDSAAARAVAKPPQTDSKEITIGEYHDEEVGAPMEHTVHEYNKIRFFDSPSKMKPIYSKGPILYEEDMGGLYLFENVCLTQNVDALRYQPNPDSGLRGLIFFTSDEDVQKNPRRCVPCSLREPLVEWEDSHPDDKKVGHNCGMNGLHAMYASSVGDWSDCIMEEENAKLMKKWGQTQSPVNVSTIHFFQEPTFALQFDALDMEKSLFDMLLTYLPHWDKFLNQEGGDEGIDGFPFDSVISHSVRGCLSHSHNWFCEVLHQMYAFGEAKEIPWEGDEGTLYCYKELYYNQVGYQRNLDHDGLLTKENFGEFREVLFRKFGLPRRRTVEARKEEAEYEAKTHQQGKKGGDDDADDGDDTKIIFYDNKLSQQTVWNEMESLISKARELEKFQNVKFVTVKNFDDLTVAQQARRFNEADAIIMAHGSHMANAIFAVDGTSFVEVGCKVESLIGNPKFMALMDGKYRAVEKCESDGEDSSGSDVCVQCQGDDVIFAMTPEAFEQLIDDVVAGLAK